jgi:hypothetical protein
MSLLEVPSSPVTQKSNVVLRMSVVGVTGRSIIKILCILCSIEKVPEIGHFERNMLFGIQDRFQMGTSGSCL